MNKILTLIASLLYAASLAFAQNVSSSVRANIVDPSGAAVPGAQCLLTNQATRAVQRVKSDAQGSCVVNIVPAGAYTFAVEATGFKKLESKDVIVTAGELRTLGNLTLEVGAITESVEVTGEVSQIQLATGEKSGTISLTQLQNIAIRGRDLYGFLATIPGIVDDGSVARETTSPDAQRGTYINGGRSNQKNFTVDGVTALDTGSNDTVQFEPNMDAIAEIKVLTSNYQAEYGRNSLGTITVITRNGSRDLHGTAYTTYRNEKLNANSFFNNRTGTEKPVYRYRITGYSVGGPVFIPRRFNKNRDKLFFFWDQEYTGMRKDYGTKFVTMPTQAERNGDFSQSLNAAGQLIVIYDPQTGRPFPGNKFAANRFSTLGSQMLNFFPLPNYNCAGCPGDADPALRNQRNYRSQYSGPYPKREDVFRVDYNITPAWQVYYRYIRDKDEQTSSYGLSISGALNYPLTPMVLGQPGRGQVAHVTKVFSPTLVNEFIFGKSHNNVYFYPLDAGAVDRSKVGNPPQWFPHTTSGVSFLDKANYMPNISFGGQPANTAIAALSVSPFENYNDIYSFTENLSTVKGAHNLKFGAYIEHTTKFQVGSANTRGAFSFSTNANNVMDTKDSLSNALLGVINTYSEATARVNGNWIFENLEFYAQDNWRVSKRLTLDLGIRFYHVPPQRDSNHTCANMDPGLYSRANAPMLYAPALNASGARVAVDPRTGIQYPNPYIDLFIPGTGNMANGAAVGGVNGYPEGLYTVGALYYGPRFGFAWDIFGNGRTALRGGFGMFQDRVQGNMSMSTNGNPPVAFSPTLYFGALDTYANNPGLTGPTSVSNVLGRQNPGTTLSWSFGVQRQIGSFAMDVSYVANHSYHLFGLKDLNPIPMGAQFNPANLDSTRPGNALPDNFLRPYYGWGSINLYSNTYSSNYNSLQVSVNRRVSHGLQLGIAFTHSRALGTAQTDSSTVSPYFTPRMRNYGPLPWDRPNQFVANYVYDLPKVGTRMNVRPARWVLDNWQISGIAAMVSGAPFQPVLGFTTSTNVTGSAEGARLNQVAACGGPKTFAQWFNTAAFTAPVIGAWGNPNVTMANFGNMATNVCRGPGANNWDFTIAKRFPLLKEGRFVQFGTELFNAFNHTQWAGVDSATSFSPANPSDPRYGTKTYGQVNSARTPRVIKLSLRVSF